MNKILETLFYQWKENSMNTKEAEKAFNVLCDGKDISQRNKRSDVLSDALNEECYNAFYAGFKTAVQLLMGGEQI